MSVTGRKAPREDIMPSDTASSLSFLRIVDLIPGSDSREVDQNSEPSIAVNPVDPLQMFAGAFIFDGTDSPFFVSTDGGGTWSIFGSIEHHDKSIAWKADGSGVLVARFQRRPRYVFGDRARQRLRRSDQPLHRQQ
jgi:hypothetical protein